MIKNIWRNTQISHQLHSHAAVFAGKTRRRRSDGSTQVRSSIVGGSEAVVPIPPPVLSELSRPSDVLQPGVLLPSLRTVAVFIEPCPLYGLRLGLRVRQKTSFRGEFYVLLPICIQKHNAVFTNTALPRLPATTSFYAAVPARWEKSK